MDQVAKTHFDSFDKLLDVYEKVGEAIPGLLAYRSMLEKHPPLATVLEDYYSDILRFHEAALKVFTRSSTFLWSYILLELIIMTYLSPDDSKPDLLDSY